MPSKRDRDATRSERKAKRRIAEDRIPDLPGETEENGFENSDIKESANKKRRRDNIEADENTYNSTPIDSESRAAKKSRKNNGQSKGIENQKDLKSSGEPQEEVIGNAQTEQDDITTSRKSKKERKAEKKALRAVAEHVADEKSVISNAGVDSKAKVTKKETKNQQKVEKKRPAKAGDDDDGVKGEEHSGKAPPRFIVFVGNLPYTATKASILEHFAKVKPKDIRNLTEKDNPSKSRGIAFVEFDGYDRMKTCLKLMHHSEFNDGKSAPRKINVELTAGGGGKTKQRTAKIAEKNHKLQEERFRRVQEEEKLKVEKKESANVGDVHPSRRGRLGLD